MATLNFRHKKTAEGAVFLFASVVSGLACLSR